MTVSPSPKPSGSKPDTQEVNVAPTFGVTLHSNVAALFAVNETGALPPLKNGGARR